MKVLLDHDLPKQLRLELPGHLTMTARQMNWDKLSNGRLLAAAEAAGFDVLITGDRSMYFQQDHAARKIAILVLTGTSLPRLRPILDKILEAIRRCQPGGYEVLSVPSFQTKVAGPPGLKLKVVAHHCL